MKIGLLTSFSAMIEHYSLTGVVLDQARMIHNAGHTPVLFTLPDFKWSDAPEWLEIRSVLPYFKAVDYSSIKDVSREHIDYADLTADILSRNICDLSAVFTHDIMFTGWNLPIGMAVRKVAERGENFFLHWVHSVPGGGKRDFWALPPNGKLVFPNSSDRIRCAEHFGASINDVLSIPHSVDPRNFLMQTEYAKALVTDFDVLAADFVQTLPVPTDRMEHKGIAQVILVLSRLKELGRSVKLIVCNSWCTTPALRSKVNIFRRMAAEAGLNDREVIFTSMYFSGYEVGVPNNVVRDFMTVSNLFICPTKSETFGITVAEAALTGQLLVLNANLPALSELAGPSNALYFTFGSHQQKVDNADWGAFYTDVARIICHRFDQDESLKAKTHYRKTYRMEAVWRKIEAALQSETIGARVAVRTE